MRHPVLLPLLLMTACGSAGPSSPETEPAPPPASPAAPAEPEAPEIEPVPDRPAPAAAASFGAHMYDRLRADAGNLVFSPASIELALTMTYGGAKGETAEQMASVLGIGGADPHVRAGDLLRRWNADGKAYELAVVNRIYTEQMTDLVPAFVDLSRKHYAAGHEAVDFRTDFEVARKKINGWVAQQTNDRIQDLLPDGSLDELTRVVLTNAVYFLGTWEKPFDEKATYEATFHAHGNTGKKVPTMHQTADFGLARLDGLSLLELPYAGGDLSMVIALPDARDGLSAMEDAIVDGELDTWIDELRETKTEVALPRFKIEMPRSIALKKHLQAMGMPLAFTDGADFTGMSDPPDPAERLKISNAYHKAFIEVNEEGTEAAAATAVVMVARGAAMKVERFAADHPFFFAIRDRKKDAILFMGRVSDPSD